jgi:dienelactone hydrolase
MRIVTPTTLAMAILFATIVQAQHPSEVPERVTFPSADGRTRLVGYLYLPSHKTDMRVPAVVMMHGRSGAYSTLAKGQYDASTLSKRHQMWGQFWSAQGFVAILVDGFGPRGYPAGFLRRSYDDRPQEFNEVTVRPLDAYGTLAWLRTRADVIGDIIGLQGWSNGGSATLATMETGASTTPTSSKGFTAALVFYPGCETRVPFPKDYRPYAPVRVFHGTADEEVSYRACRALVERARGHGGDIEITLYQNATHDFDAPIRGRQSVEANADAKADAMEKAQHFFAQQLSDRPDAH